MGKSSLRRHLTHNFTASVVVTCFVNGNSTQRKEKKHCLVSSFNFQIPESTSQSRKLFLHKVRQRSIPVIKGVLVVGIHLVCHLTVFILASIAITPSVVELVIKTIRGDNCIWASDYYSDMCDSIAHIRIDTLLVKHKGLSLELIIPFILRRCYIVNFIIEPRRMV